jgi:amidophosphoribosyltransferase
MVEAIGREDGSETGGHCLACFTGKYPTEIYPKQHKEEHEEPDALTAKN